MQGSEAPNEIYQRFITIYPGLLQHSLADLTLDGAILLAVNGRLSRRLARWLRHHPKQIPAMRSDSLVFHSEG
jgi:hypothetical protein